MMRWGLVPSWAKDWSIGNKLINARAETVAEKPSFRSSFERKRCLVPADGFYEWKRSPDGRSKTPMCIQLRERSLFAFAGLWDSWRSAEGAFLHSFTIITTEPNEMMGTIHHRMPVIVAPEDEQTWLASSTNKPQLLLPLLRPYRGEMSAYEVSPVVNIPTNDTPACIEPI